MLFASALRRVGGDFSLDQQARLDDLKRREVLFRHATTLATVLGLADIDAAAHADLHQAGDLERDQRLAHRRA